jgi:putative glutamine amidotransferase
VQWHPEWQVVENPFARRLFAAFGAAARRQAIRHARMIAAAAE